MDLQERIGVLIQGVELAQKKGVLTLDDAYYAKQAVDALKNNVSLREAFSIINKTVNIGQKGGVYSLRDSYYLYLALDNYESVISIPAPAPAPVQAPAPAPANNVEEQPDKKTGTVRKTKKES
jgi:hypothetical protein